MRIFDVTGCTAQIVRPGMTLTAWAAQNHPYAVCNASLYDFGTRIPIGTIIEDGNLVHNDGNGYGCGIPKGKTALDFGDVYSREWRDYLTGYNSPVQNGAFVAPSWNDSYVFGCRLSRIGVGRKSGRTFIATADGVTLQEFALHAISAGFDTLVNLDGGGSRHLYYDGKLVYQSPRVPYNAVAFYKDEAPKPEKPECPYPVPTRNLLIGCKGDDVKWLQWQLNAHGFDCGSVDGIFGGGTWRALWNYQKTWSKMPDGICGINTRGELLK